MRTNEIVAHYKEGELNTIGTLYQYDYGQRIVFEDIDLPQAYEVQFSNEERGESLTMIGDETGVAIPDELLQTGKNIYIWIYLHTGANDGETVYRFIINVRKRAEITDAEPTPVQQGVIEQTIAALNSAVETAQGYAEDAEDAAELLENPGAEAETLPSGSEATVRYDDGTFYFGIPKGEPGQMTDLIDDTAGAGDTDRTWSADKLTSDFSNKADKSNTVLNDTLSRGRKPDTIVGEGSIAFGYMAEAAGAYSQAFGGTTTAKYSYAHAEGYETQAYGMASHAEGIGGSYSDGTTTYKSEAGGNADHTEGYQCMTGGTGLYGDHAEGYRTRAVGGASHAEGNLCVSSGEDSHAEGYQTRALGWGSHAEGLGGTFTKDGGTYISGAYGRFDHTEGYATIAVSNQSAEGYGAHAEGYLTRAERKAAHAEGIDTLAEDDGTHAEGCNTKATETYAHAEGFRSTASEEAAHAEGMNTTASGVSSHAEGYNTVASAAYSHAEGGYSKAAGANSHAEGYNTVANAYTSHAEGNGGTFTIDGTQYTSGAYGTSDHSEGYLCMTAVSKPGNHAEGFTTRATGGSSHSEGDTTLASGSASHAEGNRTLASGSNSHAEGNNTVASGTESHAEGANNTASGTGSHAEGNLAKASSNYSHAEGYNTVSDSPAAHAEGYGGTFTVDGTQYTSGAHGTSDHSEGYLCVTGTNTMPGNHAEGHMSRALGGVAHAEGNYTLASGFSSHAEGTRTIANGSQTHASGMYNVAMTPVEYPTWVSGTPYEVGDKVVLSGSCYVCKDANSDSSFTPSHWVQREINTKQAFVIGNGISTDMRSNAMTVEWDGNARFNGDVYTGASVSGTGGEKLATETFITSMIGIPDGIASLDSTGKVPSSCLPSYVDDVEEYNSLSEFPVTGDSGKIYIAKDTNKTYRWGGSDYVEISASLALGETSSTAYRGDRGKAAYDHATESGKVSAASAEAFYKVGVTAEGHIASVSAVTKTDITDLGIPGDVSGKADKVSGATNGNFASLDSNGNLTDSGHKHSDYLTAHQDVSGKADKVTSAVSGDFAGLDENGNLTDSGKKASDFATPAELEAGLAVKANKTVGTVTEQTPVMTIQDGADGIPMKLSIGIELVQAGTGDPSPTNVRAITGWTGCNIKRSGQSLVYGSFTNNAYLDTQGVVQSNANWMYTPDYTEVEANTTYALETEIVTSVSNTNGASVCYYDSNKTFIRRDLAIDQYTAGGKTGYIKGMFTTPANTKYIRFNCRNGSLENIISKGDATKYTVTFPTAAGTVYSGTLTVNKDGSGTIVADRASITLGSADQIRDSSVPGTGKFVRYNLTGGFIDRNSVCVIGESVHGVGADLIESANAWDAYVYGTEISYLAVFVPSDATTTDVDNAIMGSKVVYLLATPVTYTLTADQITTVLDTNVIYADTGDILSVDYSKPNDSGMASSLVYGGKYISPDSRGVIDVSEIAVITETVSGTTPEIIGVANHRYICGECSTLDITPPVSGCIDVMFTSGTTATVLTLDSSAVMPDWWEGTEADKVYEINFLNGYGVVTSWATN